MMEKKGLSLIAKIQNGKLFEKELYNMKSLWVRILLFGMMIILS